MTEFDHFKHQLTQPSTLNFEAFALELFRFQYRFNPVYHQYTDLLNRNPAAITRIEDIPFIPVEFFKHHDVVCGNWEPDIIYTSSGTTGSQTSRHLVQDRLFYLEHATSIFEAKYGPLSEFHVLALLPSYLEREGSSLIDMAAHFIKESKSDFSGFYLYNHEELKGTISRAAEDGDRKILLLGVSFALLDLAESGGFPNVENLTVMETGGMKGRRKEMVRDELHSILTEAFHVQSIHSEYGMTEAMSQAYSFGQGNYSLPFSMRLLLRDPNDPLDVSQVRTRGAINIIDLANYGSCAFLQTSDVGERLNNDQYRIAGRMDNSDVRGCNLMIQTAL